MTTVTETKPDTYTHVHNWDGRRFAVRLVRPGERYGAGRCLTYGENDKISWSDGQPMVEFYDATYAGNPHFDMLGQFVSRYGLTTIRQDRDRGLNLDGGIPVWYIDSDAMGIVQVWLDAQERGIDHVVLVKAPQVDSDIRSATDARIVERLERADGNCYELEDKIWRLQRTLKAESEHRDQLRAEDEWRTAHYPSDWENDYPSGDNYTGPCYPEYED